MNTRGVGVISMTEAALTMNVFSTGVHAIILYSMTPTKVRDYKQWRWIARALASRGVACCQTAARTDRSMHGLLALACGLLAIVHVPSFSCYENVPFPMALCLSMDVGMNSWLRN